jgi:hypothetical protein
MRRAWALALLVATGLAHAGCMGGADADSNAIRFSEATPRDEILGTFPEVLTWSAIAIDATIVPGQNRCVITVAVSDSTNAATIRDAFMPIAEAGSTNLCPPVVAIRLVPHTREEVTLARQRIDSLLAGVNVGGKALLTQRGNVVVEVKNFASVERARAALEADDQLPEGIVTSVRPRLWMREAENPRQPPLEAYTTILGDLYRRVASPGTSVGVLRSSLPNGFADRHLAGMPIRIVDDASAVAYLVTFGATGQLEDGVFTIATAGNRTGASSAPAPVGVDCVGGECFLVDVAPHPAGGERP